MARVAVLTSGGDAPGMNAAIRAVVRCGVLQGLKVLGVRRGYSGLIAGDFIPLGPREVGGIIHQAGTLLETSRCEEFKSTAGQQAAVQQLHDHDISNLIVIGGSGSQAGSQALSTYGIRVIGIASTIDNDLPGIQLRMTRLGHVQRGGTPGAFDRILASRLGAAAIEFIGRGQFGCLVGIHRGEIIHTPLSEVAGRSRPLDSLLLELARALAT